MKQVRLNDLAKTVAYLMEQVVAYDKLRIDEVDALAIELKRVCITLGGYLL